MSDVKALVAEVLKYGARLVPAADGMLTLADGGAVPGWLRDAVKAQKAGILASFAGGELDDVLFGAPPPSNAAAFHRLYGKWPWLIDWQVQHHGRRSLLPEEKNGMLFHWCPECGRWGSIGYDVDLRAGRLGVWYCGVHLPPVESRLRATPTMGG